MRILPRCFGPAGLAFRLSPCVRIRAGFTFHDGDRLVSLDQETGELSWQSDPVTRRESFTFNFGPRLVIHEDVVLYSGGDGKMQSRDAKTGEVLWQSSFPNSGYQSPQDLMVMDGLVWVAPLTSGKDSGVYTGRDPRSGEVKEGLHRTWIRIGFIIDATLPRQRIIS